MKFYKDWRIIHRQQPRWVTVDETGKVINRNPSKEELGGLDKFFREDGRSNPRPGARYTDKELLSYLLKFYEKHGRPPTRRYFVNNPEYPSYRAYGRFGDWQKGLKLVELDYESMAKKGILEDNYQKGRQITVRDHFKNNPVDLSGDNCNSSCDGICPNGKTYDVKTSKLLEGKYWLFHATNKYKEEIEIYYLLAFNEDWTKLEHAWRLSGEMVDVVSFSINKFLTPKSRSYRNVEGMKEYEITDRLTPILNSILKSNEENKENK
jgi:hypothetical protein